MEAANASAVQVV